MRRRDRESRRRIVQWMVAVLVMSTCDAAGRSSKCATRSAIAKAAANGASSIARHPGLIFHMPRPCARQFNQIEINRVNAMPASASGFNNNFK
jgi:hypothetical protein